MTRIGRLARAAAGLVVPLALLAACSGNGPGVLESSCACGPIPTQVPWPISDDAALNAARLMLGAVDVEIGRASLEPAHVYVGTGGPGFALVCGNSGAVIEAVFLDAIPGDAPRLIQPSRALDAALAFVQQHPEVRPTGTPGVFEADHALDRVSWIDGGSPTIEVAVNANTGTIVSFVDLRGHPDLVPPTIRSDAALHLAAAAFGVLGEQAPTPPELRVEIDAGGHQRNVWSVGLGVPSATQADVYLHGGLVEVDAVTGAMAIIKR